MRIEPLSPEQTDGDTARALAYPAGKLMIFRQIAHARNTVLPVMRLGGAILGKQALDARTRELMILLALRLEGGRYEWPQHVEIGIAAGITEAEVAAIDRLDLTGPFDARDQALLAFARAVVEDVQVDDAVFAAAHAHLDDQRIVEAVVTIGFYMMLARVTEALDMGPEPAQGKLVIESVKG